MKRLFVLSGLMGFILTLGIVVLAQSTPNQNTEEEEREISFVIESEIGRALPRSIIYDPNFERLAVVDAYNKLTLVDALTYETQHVLYDRGNFNDYAFSHNGRWLALAVDSRIELWDTETGQLAADLVDLSSARRVVGPLAFSADDTLLKFEGVYPAPRSIRIAETDTINVPWLWHLPAAVKEGTSTFPRQLEAWQFYDYRNGFVLGPDDRIVAALPARLVVFDAHSLEQLFEIPTARYERDPLNVWFSLRDNKIYVRPVTQNTFLQVDTQAGVLVEIPLNSWLTQSDLELVGGIELSRESRVIGPAENRRNVELLEALLGTNYRDRFGLNPLTVTLVDLVVPPAATEDNVAALLFIFDERTQDGLFLLTQSSFYGLNQMVLSPDGNNLIIRRNIDGEEFVVTYDLNTGDEINRFIPATRSIGYYSRVRKNRVLAYDEDGSTIISDFQRINAQTTNVVAEDLRYSRRFERFFFTNDSENIVTLSGSEWRLWDVETGQVVRREVINFRGSIQRTSRDGFRYLTRYSYSNGFGEGVEVIDMAENTRRNVDFEIIPGSNIGDIIPDEDWERFYVIYSVNNWGQYAPGNQIAMYDLDDGLLWHIAGDDLPPVNERQYGWVDDETVYVSGSGYVGEQPARIYGLEYDASGLPTCAVQAFPDQLELWVDLWERLVLFLRPDTLGNLTQLICDELPDSAEEVQQMLLPTSTPIPVTPTPIVIPGVPVCLTARYPDRAQEYAATWAEITEGLTEEQIRETEFLLCEGIGIIRNEAIDTQFIAFTMMIDAETGERATGSFTPIERIERPVYPIYEEFERTEERQLGQAILAPNEELVAASSLPGELIVYRMIRPYQTLIDQITATAQVEIEQRNLIAVLPSPTPTYNAIGTPRPTLTPTMTLTPIPRPDERVEQSQAGEVIDLCPSEQLISIQDAPEHYTPTGRIVAPASGDDLWAINPATGRRGPDATIPICGLGINCQFSPDRSWILADSPIQEIIYVVRPDGSDERVLFGEDDRKPPFINWTGPRTVEYEVTVIRERNGREERVTALQRDILGVFPDPEPWIPEVGVNGIRANIIERQPGGPWVLVYTVFSTGVGPGYKYYLYNTDTRDYVHFARSTEGEIRFRWHPQGDRLFYHYPPFDGRILNQWYQINVEGLVNRSLGVYAEGTWSNEGRYVAYATERRTQPIAVYDSQTGLTRTYCIPETGARAYNGAFIWSPDSRYVALQAPLPADENRAGVGQHVMILDIETGEIIDLTTGVGSLLMWSQNPGTYGGG